ncbi:MAG: DUF2244 domain-containing protein [Pseudolabrys sp.]
MTSDNLSALEGAPPIFAAIITPHRSLGSTGFLILMAAVAVVSFGAGMAFLMMGAWPVLGFFGLDVALLYWAFRINYRRASAFEEITVTPEFMAVRKVSHRGEVKEWRANPLWVRLEQDVHEDYGVERLSLVSRGERVAVGGFLGPEEKVTFAHALDRALAQAKRGPDRSASQ